MFETKWQDKSVTMKRIDLEVEGSKDQHFKYEDLKSLRINIWYKRQQLIGKTWEKLSWKTEEGV